MATFALKNRYYFIGSKTLEAQICIAMGVNIGRHWVFWEEVGRDFYLKLTPGGILYLREWS